MAYSYAQFTADGNTDIFNVTFPFIGQKHIAVLVNGVPVSFVWHTEATVKLGIKPAAGALVRVKRTTPTDVPLAKFINGVPLAMADLNTASTQTLYALQEYLDNMAEQLAVNGLDQWDGRGKRLVSLADPVDAQDAATKAWVLSVPNTTLADSVAAALAAKAAQEGAEQAQNTAVQAITAVEPRIASLEEAVSGKLDKALLATPGTFVVGGESAPVAKTASEVADALVGAGKLVQLNASGQLPAVSGALLTGLQTLPAGAVIFHASSTVPTGYLECNGALISRTAYAALYAAIGTTYGVGDGSTTFGLPDLRGEFLRGWDDGRGVDSGRALGSNQSESARRYAAAATISGGMRLRLIDTPSWTATHALGTSPAATSSAFNSGTELIPSDSAENRPRNVALLACIKY